MIKNNLVVFLAVLILFALGGCGVQDKVNEKVGEKVTEGILNHATDGNAKVDIDGDKMSIKGKDGEEFSFGDTKWPDNKAARLIPEFKKGKVVSVLNSDGACLISVEQVKEKDAQQYLEEIKSQGFTNDTTEYSFDNTWSYSANKDENSMISLSYNSESQGLSITVESKQ